MKSGSIVLLALLLLLGACSKPPCLHDQPYQRAQEFPPLRAPAGLNVPSPDPNMAIPEVDDGPVGGVRDPDAPNRFGVSCLDTPPRLPAAEDASGSAAPESD